MATVLVTGGTGGLGSALVPRFASAGHTVRILSRRTRPPGTTADIEWAQGDVVTGGGIDAAVLGADLIIHAATGAGRRPKDDVAGTRMILDAARRAGTPHFFYVSIVGIERVPFAYYRAKVECEALVGASGVPWTILRATQFHSLIDRFLRTMVRFPIALLPADLKFQPIETGEVAERVVAYAAAGPSGRLPDLGGPQVLTFGEMAKAWLKARHQRALLLPIPMPGKTAAAFRRGYNCAPEHADGQLTWPDWLKRTYGG